MNIKYICQSLNLENEKSIALFSINENFKISEWSSGCKTLFGYSQNDVIEKTLFETIIPVYLHESLKNDLKNKSIQDFSQLEFKTKEEKTIFLNTIVRYIDNHIIFLLTPEVKRDKYKISNILTSKLSKDVVISLDKNGYIYEFNNEASSLTGYREEEVIGRNFIELLLPESHKEKIFEQVQQSFRKKESLLKDEFPIICKDGSKKVLNFDFKLFNHRHRDYRLFLISKNQTKNSSRYQQMNYFASFDILTDLPNINLFKQKLQEEMNKVAVNGSMNLLLLYLDIKNFSSINYTLGTKVGDELLQIIAQKLNTKLRNYDIVARVSSNRFALLFNKLPDELYATKIIDRVLSLFKTPFKIGKNIINIDIYIGATLYPSDGNNIDKLISNVELALNKAKKSSKSDYKFFMPSMYDEISRKHEIKQSIREALEQNQFYVVYQPQVDSYTQKIYGVEALIRWNHPKLKNIPPLDFIPIAEDNGLILEIGKLVLDRSIKEIKSLHDKGWNNLNLSVNISAIQLLQSDLVKTVTELLEKYNFNPANLHLELTESIFMQNMDLSRKLLNKFRDLGLKISIDDFGTGFSSLSYIGNLPIDILKIDKTFIKVLDEKSNPIVDAIISMAHALNMIVIAEGAENKEQYKYLRDKKCDYIQGYYFSKPISYEKLQSYKSYRKITQTNEKEHEDIDIEKELRELML